MLSSAAKQAAAAEERQAAALAAFLPAEEKNRLNSSATMSSVLEFRLYCAFDGMRRLITFHSELGLCLFSSTSLNVYFLSASLSDLLTTLRDFL